MDDADLIVERAGGCGLLTLNRPAALHALTLELVRRLTEVLLRWRDNPGLQIVLLRGQPVPGRTPAFCAGGDIRFMHRAVRAGDPRLEDFFTEEYALDHLIHRYPKPVVAWIDGICMGGGMGLAQGAALRVVTENARLAMPETQIGLFPDVGGGWFLSRCPGRWGEFLGLTGQSLDAAAALALGLADIHLPADRWPAVWEAWRDQPMEDPAQALAVLRAHASAPPATPLSVPLAAWQRLVDRHFAAPDLPSLVRSLEQDPAPEAAAWRARLGQLSPLMLAVTLEQVRRARSLSLEAVFRLERGMMRHCFHRVTPADSDAVEGIRALAVDKDRQPRWRPGAIEQVDPAQVAAFFDPPWPDHAHPLRTL